MANQEQLEILKQGAEVWNRWREENPDVEIDLSNAPLIEDNLAEANLFGANLTGAYLTGAILKWADLFGADLFGANLSGAVLVKADLGEADLTKADLQRAVLLRADLSGANLSETKFSNSLVVGTILADLDLVETIGLEEAKHHGPSTVGTNTLVLSKGKIPEAFLRGCGLSDWEIESAKLYNPDLSYEEIIDIQNRIFDLRNRQAIQISNIYISYSHADSRFVDKVERALNKKGVRFWRDIHDATAGRLEKQIDRAIRHNPTVLLVLSEKSIKSDWVEYEVRTARELEKDTERDVLCPVALDDSWKDSPWPKRLMEQVMEYNILDFSDWEDDSKFEDMFRRLIDGLELFYER